MRRQCKRRFADIDCEVSGTDSGDESDIDAEENEDDRNFIDDAPVEETGERQRIRIRRCEREVSKDDRELVLENVGLRGRRRAEPTRGTGTVYKDSDEDGANSEDDNFVVTDSDEEIGKKASKLIRDYVRREGAKRPSDSSLLQQPVS